MSIQKIILLKEKLKELKKENITELAIEIKKYKKEATDERFYSIHQLISLLYNSDDETIKEFESIIIQFLKNKKLL